MHEYDIALKETLRQVDLAMRELTGRVIARWLNVETPQVQNPRVDLLGEAESGDLVHLELQSTNDMTMPLRMAEYCLRVYRQFRRFPYQVVVYIGDQSLRMETDLRGPNLLYSYRLIDIRELDGERLLESPRVGDNIVAVLTRLNDVRGSIRCILRRVAELSPGEREKALLQLLILSDLRSLGDLIETEAKQMPILNDILDHKVLGREYKRGLQEGERIVLRRLIEKRFGALPGWAEQRLTELSASQLEDLSVRVLDVNTLEELLG